jgi:hypothetical protein
MAVRDEPGTGCRIPQSRTACVRDVEADDAGRRGVHRVQLIAAEHQNGGLPMRTNTLLSRVFGCLYETLTTSAALSQWAANVFFGK